MSATRDDVGALIRAVEHEARIQGVALGVAVGIVLGLLAAVGIVL